MRVIFGAIYWQECRFGNISDLRSLKKKKNSLFDFIIYFLKIMPGICSGQDINYSKEIFTNTSGHSHTFFLFWTTDTSLITLMFT